MLAVIALPPAIESWLTGGLILAMVATLATGRFGADIVFLGGLTALVVLGILDPRDAIAGFAEPGVITVALLYVVSTGMKETGATNMVVNTVLGRPEGLRGAQTRLAASVAATSAFVNNTPIVAMFLPVLASVAKRGGFAASKLYMPLSFASILGGTCTLIGTSTTVIVAGLLEEATRDAETPIRFGMFTLAGVGLPIALAGLAYIILFGRKLLPDRTSVIDKDKAERREYMTAVRVEPGSSIAGKTIEQAGLRHLPSLYLARIDRGSESIIAASPNRVLQADDALNFVGDLDAVVDLQQIRGLAPITDEAGPAGYRPNLQMTEAVVANSSRIIGQTIRDSGIRSRYGAVVIAVHRRGHRLRGKIGDIVVQSGDTLLLEADPGFADRYRDSRDFYLVTDHPGSAAPRHERAWIALAVLAGIVILITTGLLSPMPAAMVGAGAMILTRCCTGPQARAGVDWQVLVTIGAAFGLGNALKSTGLAAEIAHAITDNAAGLGPIALLAAVYILTTVFTMLMTNNAAAVLMFPVAMGIADEASLSILPFAVVIAIAASCEFSTPIGYQTNLMVMGPGGYRWLDYTRFGGPLTILAAIICLALVPFVYGPLELG